MKFLSYMQKKRRAMLAMAAFTFLANPFSAQASNITTKAGVTLKPTNNVYNIEVQQRLSSKVGVNKFTHFNLDRGQIANMQFGNLETLANLVDNRISINGTVNAIREGKIGGNLYFLSPNGIAVGSSGVINAGSFTGMAVSQDYFDKLSKLSDDNNATGFTNALKPENIAYNNDPDNGIDIQGVINAPGGISLYATKIDIGKDAVLRTDVSDVDFSKVVNIMSGDKVAVDSGLTGELDAEYKDGDIILKAYAENIADDSTLDKDFTADDVKDWEKISETEATINVDGTLISANDISINAEAVTTFSEGEKFNALTEMPIDLVSDFNLDASVNYAKKTNKATVNIGKTADLYSKGNMEISATATLNAKIETVTPAKGEGNKFVPATAVAVISADNEAAVNVEGKLKSDGRMAINATADTTLEVKAQTKTAIDEDNEDAQESKFFIAVGVIDGISKAEVNIESADEIIVGGEDGTDDDGNPVKAFEANAIVKNKLTSSVTASSEDNSTINTAVNVISYTSDAILNVDSTITAENGSIKLNASNTSELSGSTSNTLGSTVDPFENPFELDDEDEDPDKAAEAKDIQDAALETINEAIKLATEKIGEKDSDVPDEAGGSTFDKVLDGKYFKGGVAVGVVSQKNSATVNVKNNAKITAKDDVEVNAITEISRQNFSVDSAVNNQSEDQETAAMVGLGVLVTDIQNTADVVVDGTLTATNGDVKITADSGMDYDPVEALVSDLNEAIDEIKKDANELKEDEEVSEKIDEYSEQISDTKVSSDPAEFMETVANIATTVKNITQDIKSSGLVDKIKDSKLKEDIDKFPTKITAFAHPASYSNYYARATFADTKEEDSSKIDAAGSIAIDSMINNSRVLLNDNSVVNAGGNVEVNSNAKNNVVSITGMGGEFLTSSEAAKKGVGVSVKVGNFDNNALALVGKSQITANDINLKSQENSKHVNIIYGNGKADSTTITGMVSYIKSPTDSILAINKSAKLNATNNLNLEASGEDFITSVNGAVTLGNGGGKSFGAAVNILSNDKNVAVKIGDNGLDSATIDKISKLKTDINSATDEKTLAAKKSELKSIIDSAISSKISTLETDIKSATDENILVDKKSELKSLKITKRTNDILGQDYLSKMDAGAVNADGIINAKNLTVKADNTGTINAIAIEGTENSESHGLADAFNKNVSKGETALNYADDSFKWTSTKLLDVFSGDGDLDISGQKKPTDAANQAGKAAGNSDGGAGENAGVNNNVQSQLNIAGAGSGAINIKSGETGTLISNANIQADAVNVSANDDSFNGAWAGAGAFNFFGKSQSAKNTNVAIGGAVAYSDNSKNVDAIIKNSTINAASIKNTATRDDSDVAAGMGLAVSTNKGKQGSNVDVAISASINFVDGDTHALLIDNTVKRGSIENNATLDSLQVAGGLDIAGSSSGGKGFNIGGAAAASKITNDLQSGIKGGSYENLTNVDITANKKANQIDVAVAGGLTTGSGTKGFSFGGAVAVSDINNNARAFLNDTDKFNATGTVNVDALDTKNTNSRNEYLSSRSINTNPTSFLNDSDKSKVNLDGGGNIVNVAFGAGGSTSEAAAGGLGISYAGIKNVLNVDIANNSVTAKNLNANAANNSNIVNVTVGLAGSNKSFSGAGAFGVSDIKNDGTINISNTNTTADNFLNSAQSNAHIVNIAGQAALASKFSGGLTFAYNAMNNTAGVNVKGGTHNVKEFDATSTNHNYALALGAGVGFSKNTGALNGAISLNLGNNSTKAILDGSTLSNLSKLNVFAIDNTAKNTIAGDIAITKGGKVAAGGAVAYADIGTSDNKEVINAKISNATISALNNATIDVQAIDNATMNTVAVGVGGALSGAKVTFQGAAAVSEVNKDNVAEISNTNFTGSPDIKITAASSKSSSSGLNIGDKINVDNKVNTAAAVLDANLSSESWFDGALAISVNKFNQSTQANFKNDSRPTTVSRVSNVDMHSDSGANILGVALGGSGGKSKLSAAGSVSYNYINNSAKTLVENANVKADKNFGVVAQSDDQIANYAGAVDFDFNGYGSIGVSVAYNEIKGNTDSNVKNSKLEVTGSDSNQISISNPKDKLIDDYVTKNTWTSGGLVSGRSSENKSGLVVNSSATHSISSDLATIGIRASGKVGVGASGTVNINKISGGTNAKIESGEIKSSNEFVNATDYTNNGSFIGNAAISGTLAAGVLWNENQVKRETNALVSGGTHNVKDLDVKANSAQGLSNLNIAVAGSFATNKKQVFAAASGDNIVRNQLEGITTAKIENATVTHSGNVNVDAYHKDNAFATNIAVGAALDFGGSAGATFDMGYGLMRENSKVEAEINHSTLTGKSGAVNVNAENLSKMAGAFGTLGVATHSGNPGVSVSVALGINNNYVKNEVSAGINNGSTLDVGAVNVNAKNTSEIKADGGVAALSLNFSKTFFASMGAAVAVTNATFDNKVTAQVDSSKITAAGDVNINARDDHKSDETVVAAAGSTGIAVQVNRMSTSINSGLADLKEDDMGTPVTALTMTTDNASKENASLDADKLTGEFGKEERFINSSAIDELRSGIHSDSTETQNDIDDTIKKRYAATANNNNQLKSGVFANVTNKSTIDAGENKISIGTTENNDLSITSGGGTAAIVGTVGVGSTSIKARRANVSEVSDSTLKAKEIEVTTTNGQTGSNGILSKMYNATVAPLGVSVGYNNVETNGTGKINISGATLTATEKINASASDNSKSKSYILDAGLKQIGYTGVFAYNTNVSKTSIDVGNKSALSANAINFDTKNASHRATDTLAISVNGTLGVQTNTSEARDTSVNGININGAGNSFTANSLTFNALNSSQTNAHTNGQAYLGLNAIIASGLANSKTNAQIKIDDGNSLLSDDVNITAQIGEDNKYTAESTGFAINGSTVGVNVDEMTARTESSAQIAIGNEYYNAGATVNVNALNKASRNAFMRNNAYALVANANDISAYTIAKDEASITIGNNSTLANTNKLSALNITADTENSSHVAAKGTGGAIGGDFGSAAHADNDVKNTAEATLKGTWNITNDLTLKAIQHDNAYISGYSARGAILTGGKGSLDNVIKGTSTAKISDNAQINAKTVSVDAKNYIKTDKYSGDYDYTLYGLMIGVADDVDYQRSSATTDKTANIKIGDSAAITTTGTQNYDALNDYNLTNNVYAEGGSALASLRWVKSHNYITTDENINVGTGAILKNEGGSYSDGGITMAAHDNLELAPTAKGYSKAGAGGYVRAETLIDLDRTPTINVNGTLKSAKDLNLYAGANLSGEGSRVHSYARAISQVQTLISDGSADIIRKGKTSSNVNINSGAYGQAMHDVNIISNGGFEVYEERPFYGSTWSSSGEYKITTSDEGSVTSSKYKHNNKVTVDGELKAANTPDATITISGVAIPDGFILVNNDFKNLSYSVKSGSKTVSSKNTNFTGKTSEEIFAQQIYNGITTATKPYDAYLTDRYEAVSKEIANYQVQGVNNIAAYNGLLQEKTALEAEMVKLGMGSYNGSEFKIDSNISIEIKTVVLPDVEVSGGNINVATDNLTGAGKLNASGVPKIDVENNSSAYLVANALTIADKGGAINFNGADVASNSAINNLNGSKTGASFSSIKIADANEIPTIKVSNNYSGTGSIQIKANPNAKDYDTLPNAAKNGKPISYTPINYIELAQNVTNPVGKAIINNSQGSIRVNRGANVNAMDIEMTAKESISQGYNSGTKNIAYNPEQAYAKEAARLRSEVGWDKNMPKSNQTKTLKSDWTYTGGTGTIAGEAIYISARDININGLIQSGFAGFEVAITQDDLDKATETTFFNGTTMYKVNDGGRKLGKNGYYVYEPQVYYDKANNQLYVENINSTGGKVYLAGRISSTGNGRIVVSDGASNIKVTNSSSADMNVGKVTSTEGGGFIQIVDSEQDKLTEYSSGKTRTIENYTDWLADNTKGKVTTGDGLTIGNFVKYNPKAGLTYNWTEGTRQETTERYYYKEETSWWGLRGDSNYTSDLAELSKRSSHTPDPTKSEPVEMGGDAYYIGVGNVTSDNFTMLAQNVVTSKSYGNHSTYGPNKHGFRGFYRDYDHNWTETTGTKQIYQYSLKDDYPISVGIIGETGEPSINLANTNNSSGDLYLRGDIRNDKGELNISSYGGSIIQDEGVKIYTDKINLSAMNHIKNIDITNHRTDSLELNARSNSSAGDIDINVTGGIRDNQRLNGSVVVNDLSSKNGTVTLTAQGNLRQETDATPITARNIKLESTNGYINLKIESNGQAGAELSAISAAANGDIKLTKTDDNDFLIGSIVSTTGDVELKANGKFVDALDKVRDNADTEQSDLIKSWIDMGLIAGTKDYKGAYLTGLEKDRDNYKTDVTDQFNEYTTLLADYTARRETETAEAIAAMDKKFGKYATVDDYLAADKAYQKLTGSDREAYKTDITNEFNRYQALQMNDRLTLLDKKFNGYKSADAYLAADTDYQTLVATAKNPQYKWTEDDLISGIRSSIVNKKTGSSSDVTKLKDANITARNVTLTGTGVGTNSEKTTKITMSELRIKANETDEQKSARLAKLSQLANVEAADVTVNFAEKDGKPIVQTVTRVNYNYDEKKGYYIDTKTGNYVRYRKDADGNLLKYTYDEDLKQIGEPVVAKDFSDVILNTETIKNTEIESFVISGKIPLGINATGNITVKATGKSGVFIAGRNKGVKIDETTNPNTDAYSPLNINKIETSEVDHNHADVRLMGEAGIFNAADSGTNVIGKDLILVGGDDAIGTQAKPFTVTLTGDLLDTRSNEEINLRNIGNNNLRIAAMYSDKAIRISTDGSRIEHSTRFDDTAKAYIYTPTELTLTGTSGTIVISPQKKTIINLLGGGTFYIEGVNSGTMNLNDLSGEVHISSKGSIKQTATGTQNPSYLQVAADGDIILDRASNALDEIYVGKIGGSFLLKNKSDKLKATFTEESSGSFTLNQRGDIELAGAVSGSSLNLTTEKGNIISTGGLKADKEINLSVGTFNHIGEIHTDKLTIATDNGVKIDNTENTFNSFEISSRNGKAINGSVEVAMKADTFAPTIKNDVTGDVTLTNTKKAGGLLSFGDGETIKIGGTFKAVTNGDFEYGSTLIAGKDINIESKNIYRRAGTSGYFDANGKITFNVDADNKIGTAENPIMIANKPTKTNGLTLYGESHIRGVNDGILTLGNVMTNKDVSISSEGSIAQTDSSRISLNKITFAAAKDIDLSNANNDIETLVLNTLDGKKSTGDIKVNAGSSRNDLTVEGDLKTAGDIDIKAYKSLALTGSLESDKNISLTAGNGNNQPSYVKDITSSNDSVLKAGKQITLTAENIKLLGEVAAKTVDATIKNDFAMTNDANAVNELKIRSSENKEVGNISATSNIEITDEKIENSNVEDLLFTTRLINDVAGDLTLKSDWVVSIGSHVLKTLRVGGKITLDTGIGFITYRALWASDDINITSRNGGMLVRQLAADNNETLKSMRNVNLKAVEDIGVEGQITAGDDLTIDSATTGIDIFGNAELLSGGDMKLTVGEGDINVNGSVDCHDNVTMKVDKGDISIKNETSDAELEAGNNINLTVGEGDINVNGFVTSDGGNVTLKVKQGNIAIKNETSNAQLKAGKNLNLTVGTGDVNVSGTATADKGNVTMKVTNGNVTIDEKLSANGTYNKNTKTTKNGKITIKIGEGNIQVGNDETKASNKIVLEAGGDINMLTDNGIVNISGKTKATKDLEITTNAVKTKNTSANVIEFYSYDGAPVSYAVDTAKKPGDITIESELEAGHSVSITTDDGDIEITKPITVTNGDIIISTADGNIVIDDNVARNMVSAQNNLDIRADRGAIKIFGKVATDDGDISITSNHDLYMAGQSGITVSGNGAINPGKNLYMNTTNGDITADTLKAAETLRIALERGDLYLNLAQSKGVVIMASNSTKSSVGTIMADSVDVNDAVAVGKILPYRSSPTPSNGSINYGGSSGGSSNGYSNSYANVYSGVYGSGYGNVYSNAYSNFASNPSSYAILGSTFTPNIATYWQSADSAAAPSYDFGSFTSLTDDMSYRLTRNYFEVRFIPTWLEKEFMAIDFDYSFDNFGIRNATADELTID